MKHHDTLTDVIRATSSYEEFTVAASAIQAPDCAACGGGLATRESVLHARCWLSVREGREVPRVPRVLRRQRTPTASRAFTAA